MRSRGSILVGFGGNFWGFQLILTGNRSSRDLSDVRREGDGCGTGVSGDGQLVPHELLHLLFLWTRVAGKGVL